MPLPGAITHSNIWPPCDLDLDLTNFQPFNALFWLTTDCSIPKLFAMKYGSVWSRVPNFDLFGPQILREGVSKFLTKFIKLHLLPNMWESVVAEEPPRSDGYSMATSCFVPLEKSLPIMYLISHPLASCSQKIKRCHCSKPTYELSERSAAAAAAAASDGSFCCW